MSMPRMVWGMSELSPVDEVVAGRVVDPVQVRLCPPKPAPGADAHDLALGVDELQERLLVDLDLTMQGFRQGVEQRDELVGGWGRAA